MRAPVWIAASVGFVLAAVPAPASSGSAEQILLYPLARLFGEPPESELALCRSALGRLEARLAPSRVLGEPVMFAPGHERQWRSDWAQTLALKAGARSHGQFTVAAAPPEVAFPAKMYHNQLGYLWDRARDYKRSLREVPPGIDYLCFVEIFTGPDGNVAAIQVYLFERGGQLAFARLFNSAHFGPRLSLSGDAALLFVVNSLFDTLVLPPERVFPPYGIG